MSLLLLLGCGRETGVIEGNIPPSAVLLVPIDQGGLRQAPTLTFAALIADDRDRERTQIDRAHAARAQAGVEMASCMAVVHRPLLRMERR